MIISFYSKSPNYSWLSNFAHFKFELDGKDWMSVEHYYQAMKFEDEDLQNEVRLSSTALHARKIAKSWSAKSRRDWRTEKVKVMAKGLEAKFTQNLELQEWLLKTNEAPLAHIVSSDLFWGVNHDGEGANMLGEMIESLRQRLRRKLEEG
ncbi:MAG: NADAR family protein [Akkermansiaceae bacterium]